ncbi:hypothetical protein TRIATDRAFT_299579, partial [Trichoderma atroviride IMI 206040]
MVRHLTRLATKKGLNKKPRGGKGGENSQRTAPSVKRSAAGKGVNSVSDLLHVEYRNLIDTGKRVPVHLTERAFRSCF